MFPVVTRPAGATSRGSANARARWWKGGKTGLLPDVALRVFAHASSAEKHFIEMTERSFHRGFPLAVWMLADGGPFYNQFSL